MFAVYLTVLTLWLLLWVVFYGWGTLVCRLGRCDADDAAALLVKPWVGLASVLAVLQIWHFLAPVNTLACGVVCGVGIVAAAILGGRRLAGIGRTATRHPLATVATVLLVVWVANRSLTTQEYTDHGLYYLNAIRWASDYSIVPGLANLHNRLAFNNSNFLLHAMIEPLTGRGYSAHVLNGLMAAMAVPIVVVGLRSIFSSSAGERQVGWFPLALALIVTTSTFDRRVASATPDFPAALCVTIAAWRLLMIGVIPGQSQGKLLRWNLLTIAMLATAAFTMKTSVVFFASIAGLALAAVLYRLERHRGPRPVLSVARQLSFMVPWCAVLFLPWLERGYVLSGYPFFPSTAAGAPVDWAYNPEAAAKLRQDIYAWARTYHANVETGYQPGWGWVPEWAVQVALLRAPSEIVVPAIIAAAALCWLAWRGAKFEPIDATTAYDDLVPRFTAWLLAVAYAGAIVIWFLTAPSPRLAGFAWWGLAATLVGLASRTIPAESVVRYRALVVAAVIAIVFMPMIDEAARVEFRYRKNPNLPEFGHHFYEYFPFVIHTDDSGFPPMPTGQTIDRVTDSGLVVHLGAPLPDGKPGLLWDSPLPAARFFDSHLMLRRPGEMQSGFRMATPETHDTNLPTTP